MEPTTSTYEVRYLLNGEPGTSLIEATSAAEATEMVQRSQVQESGDGYELIQVQPVSSSEETELS